MTLRKLDSRLQGHPCMRKTPGVEMSTGSLGQGLSVGLGMALAAKLDKKEHRIFVMLGDGECDSGQVWEAAMAASHYKLENITAFVDRNGLQIDGSTSEIMNLEPLVDKFEAFGWNVLTIDGHDFSQIIGAIEEGDTTRGKPTMIIANTTKGKGVSFMENSLSFHGNPPSNDELELGIKECMGGEPCD
jgi:transketolase